MYRFFRVLAGFLLLILYLEGMLISQGTYRFFNNTNHSELNWKTYRTRNFDVIYSNGLKKTAEKAGTIAEEFYRQQKKILGLKLKRRVPFFITAADDIANGASTVFGYFFIYVYPSVYSNSFTGSEGWMRKVIGHELIHTLIFEETRSWTNFFLPLTGVPSEVHEGMAQFYSGEIWGYARGETWLSRAFRENDLKYKPGDSDYGGLLYSKGASMIRVLRQKIGDSGIRDIFKHRHGFMGYSFSSSFKKVTGESWSSFLAAWKKKLTKEYEEISSRFEENTFLKEYYTGEYKFNRIEGVVDTPEGIYIAGVLINGSRNLNLYLVKKGGENIRKISSTVTGDMDLSPSGNRLVFTRRHYGRYSSVTRDIYIYDFKNRNSYPITDNRRAVGAVFLDDKRVAFIANDGESTNIYTCDIRGKNVKAITAFKGEVRLLNLNSSKDGRFLTASLYNGNKKSHGIIIADLSTGDLREFLPGYRCPYPHFSEDSRKIFFSALKDGQMNVGYYVPETGHSGILTNIMGDIMVCGVSENNRLQVAWRVERHLWKYGTMSSVREPLKKPEAVYEEGGWRSSSAGYKGIKGTTEGFHKGNYWSISSLKHRMLIPVPFYVDQQFTIGLINMWSDMSGDNRVVIFGALNRRRFSESNYSLTYHNGSTIFDIDANIGYLDTITLDYAKKRLFERKKSFSFKLSLPLKSRKSMSEIHKFSVEYLYENAKVVNGGDFTPSSNGLIRDGIVGEPAGYIESVLTFSYEYRNREPYARFIRSSAGFNGIYSIGTEKLGGDDSFEYIQFSGHILGKILKGIFGYVGGGVRALNGRVAPQRMIGVDTYGFSDPTGLMPGLGFPRRIYQRGGKRSVSGDRMMNFTLEAQYPFLEIVNLLVFMDFAALRNSDVDKDWIKEGTWGFECQYPLFRGGVLAGGIAGNIYKSWEKWKPFLLFKGQIRF